MHAHRLACRQRNIRTNIFVKRVSPGDGLRLLGPRLMLVPAAHGVGRVRKGGSGAGDPGERIETASDLGGTGVPQKPGLGRE